MFWLVFATLRACRALRAHALSDGGRATAQPTNLRTHPRTQQPTFHHHHHHIIPTAAIKTTRGDHHHLQNRHYHDHRDHRRQHQNRCGPEHPSPPTQNTMRSPARRVGAWVVPRVGGLGKCAPTVGGCSVSLQSAAKAHRSPRQPQDSGRPQRCKAKVCKAEAEVCKAWLSQAELTQAKLG